MTDDISDISDILWEMLLLIRINSCISFFKSGRSGETYQHRSYTRQQEELCLRLGGMLEGGKTLQSSVYAGRTHEKTHGRKTSQVYRKLKYLLVSPGWAKAFCINQLRIFWRVQTLKKRLRNFMNITIQRTFCSYCWLLKNQFKYKNIIWSYWWN